MSSELTFSSRLKASANSKMAKTLVEKGMQNFVNKG
ncbi:hypothetical protein FOQG_10294 [Fusarium oxysporum f. sp. raphani 54005]|uniref:Uncharacterized protein n=5 Tax=Fusarium oxysporum TaxID=5507 RepID=W9IWG6_FUSOX|nr:hypothetical protein FOYG_05515 [Fusarium oxysporum NRRL 32931]EWZ41140.1 hypothetical protein FOZG_06549 [Fusarium oxysporum Fo47]EXA01763.1 hypothetical protein FOWG_01497 [Fusarium oxysporum f. sp. lycopersici MN25]EXA48595.1 hypothetical protein FOVG_05285 [Fusarium oxysporum f. sp. pisi HDV247]EXK85877.1 hypothetical protein FOQG_10294 [Fusarium oxysporum f. sp. raphani 54005]EXL60448.1 hypothetical protein FOCG_03299 [Fusarium oxysporum f. sp. radicis-lycopersici 26381]EXM29964.1 hyp